MTASPPSCQYESPSVLLFFLPNETHVLRFKPRLVQMRLTRSLIASDSGSSRNTDAEKQGMQEVCYHGNGKSPHSSRETCRMQKFRPASRNLTASRVNTHLLWFAKQQKKWTSSISGLLIRCGHVHPCSVNFRRHFNKNQRIWEFPVGAKLFHKHVSRWVQMLMRIGLILTNRRKGLKVHRCTITQCHSKFR